MYWVLLSTTGGSKQSPHPHGEWWWWAGGEVTFQGISSLKATWRRCHFRRDLNSMWGELREIWGKIPNYGVRTDLVICSLTSYITMNEGTFPNIESSCTAKINRISLHCRVILMDCYVDNISWRIFASIFISKLGLGFLNLSLLCLLK